MTTRALLASAFAFALVALPTAAADLPVFDAHIHYSHDAWENLPPKAAIDVLRKAGIRRALVSSSGDEGTQRLAEAAPDLILPSLRPYRSRADVSTWVRDATVVPFLEDRREVICVSALCAVEEIGPRVGVDDDHERDVRADLQASTSPSQESFPRSRSAAR